MTTKATIASGLLALTLAAGAMSAAIAQGGPGQGPGYGYGAGMRGGYGWGPDATGGGPGYGWGRGAGGPGWGRGGFGPGGALATLNLSDEQFEKIAAIQEDNRRKNWDAMGQMRTEQFRLQRMAYADKIDANAYAEQQQKVDELRRNMIKSRVEARNQIDAILTPEQRKQFRQFGPRWLQDGNAD